MCTEGKSAIIQKTYGSDCRIYKCLITVENSETIQIFSLLFHSSTMPFYAIASAFDFSAAFNTYQLWLVFFG